MKKRMAQVETADSLVKSYMGWFCKDVQAGCLNDIVPECASAAKEIPPLVPPPSTSAFVPASKHLMMLKIDLNIPSVIEPVHVFFFWGGVATSTAKQCNLINRHLVLV